LESSTTGLSFSLSFLFSGIEHHLLSFSHSCSVHKLTIYRNK
jgi:hypothetical protein